MAQETGGKRNIDERIDALAMNLELFSHSVDDDHRRFEARFEKVTGALETLVQVSNQLARTAEAHEARIADLENGAR